MTDNNPMELASEAQASTVEEWQSVDRNYIKVLRAGFSIVHAMGLLAAIIFIWLLPALPQSVGLVVIAVLVISYLWLFFVWAPRTCARIGYLVGEQDISLQKGFMFWKLISVSFNRIQHLEVRQGPIERAYGLATLVIFTAGTLGSDLQIPGLPRAIAQQLKAQLLQSINAEDAHVDEPL